MAVPMTDEEFFKSDKPLLRCIPPPAARPPYEAGILYLCDVSLPGTAYTGDVVYHCRRHWHEVKLIGQWR